MKKVLVFLILLATIFIPNSVLALNEVNVYFFYSNSCNYCSQEKAYLEALKERYFNLRVYTYEVSSDYGNDLLKKAKELYNVSEAGIPFTVIGDSTFLGFSQSKKCAMEKKIYEYSYNQYENKLGNQVLNVGYRNDLVGDVQKQYDDSSYVIEETGEVTDTTTVTTTKKSMSKKYSSSIILAGVGVVSLVCVIFISVIERKKNYL